MLGLGLQRRRQVRRFPGRGPWPGRPSSVTRRARVLLARGWPDRERSPAAMTSPRAVPVSSDEPVLVPVHDLGEGQVIARPVAGPWTGVHRHAEAGAGRRAAVNHDQQQVRPAGLVDGVRVAIPQEHAVLDADRLQLAGPDAEEGVALGGRRLGADGEIAVRRAPRTPQADVGREQVLLEGLGPDRVAEQGPVVPAPQAVAAGGLLVGPPGRAGSPRRSDGRRRWPRRGPSGRSGSVRRTCRALRKRSRSPRSRIQGPEPDSIWLGHRFTFSLLHGEAAATLGDGERRHNRLPVSCGSGRSVRKTADSLPVRSAFVNCRHSRSTSPTAQPQSGGAAYSVECLPQPPTRDTGRPAGP